MRLSEAILLGSTLRPQLYKKFRSLEGSCALGAASEAIGKEKWTGPGPEKWAGLMLAWPILATTVMICCPDCRGSFGVMGCILHLNDDHKWTREQIAEWVAKIEPAEEVAPVIESVTEAVCA